jgi:RimJ/RimL family protein N-acetyltransferase
MPPLRLRESVVQDLPFVLATEADPDVAPWVDSWTRERHLQAISDDDEAHLVFCERDETVGFLLLAGLGSPGDTIELRRIALSRRGTGLGAGAIELALGYAFEVRGAGRVWLDVLADNVRATRLYRRAGFADDGLAPKPHLLPDGSSVPLRLMSITAPAFAAASTSSSGRART